jgi:transcriptional regulator with XRE-family HTH domain
MKALKPKQVQAISLMVSEGLSYIEVAERIGVHRSTLWRWLDDATFCDELNRQLNKKITQLASKTTATILDLMEHANSEKVRLEAAKELSHLAGYIPTQKIEQTGAPTIIITPIPAEE